MAPQTRTAERIEQLRLRIEHWRRTRLKLEPMPSALWQEAASLARVLGVSPVSRALGLGYDSLQQRVGPIGETRLAAATEAGASGFVELSGAQIIGPSPTHSSGAGIEVELAASDGARLSVRLPAGSGSDLAALVGAFLSRRA